MANNGAAKSNPATVKITIGPVNDAPVCEDVDLETVINTRLEIELECTDADHEELAFDFIEQPEHGTLSIEDEKIFYIPDADFLGEDSFSYQASDGLLESEECEILMSIAMPSPQKTQTPD